MNKKIQYALLGGALIFVSASMANDASEYLTSAQKYLEKNDVKAAEIQAKNALQDDPNNAAARAMLGKIYLESGNPVAAEKEFARAIRLGGDKEALGLLLAKVLLMQGKLDDVLNKVGLGESASPESKAALIAIKGNAYLIQGSSELAEKSYDSALALVKDLPDALLGKARLHILGGKLDEAVTDVDRAIEQDSGNVEAWVLRAELMMQRNDLDAAQTSFSRALEITPGNIQAKLGMAVVLTKRDDYTQAQALVSDVLQVIPHHPKGQYLNGLILLQKKDTDGAFDAFSQVLRVIPEHAPSAFLLGSIHYARQEFEQAEYFLQKVISLSPEHVMARKMLAATYMKTGQPNKTIEVLDVIKSSTANDAQLMSLLGVAYIQAGDQEAGTALLEKAVKLSPDIASMRAQLAAGRLASGNIAEAVSELESAISLDSSLIQAELMLVYVHLQQKQFDQAIAVANKLVANNSADPTGYNLLGLAYVGKGDTDKAQKSFNQALKVDDDFNSARINLALLELKNNNRDGAEKIYKKIIQKDKKNVAAMVGLAKMLIAKSDIDGAVKWLERAHDIDASRVETAALLVDAYLKKKNSLKAIQIARATVDEAPDAPLAYESLGRAQMATKEFSSAVVTYQRLSELTNKHIRAQLLLADAYLKSDNVSAAEKVMRAAVKKDGSNVGAQVFLAQLQVSQKKFDEALKTAKTIQTTFKDSTIGHELQGDIYSQQAQYDEALDSYLNAYNTKQTPPLVLKLYQVYSKKGKTAVGVRMIEDWLKTTPEDVRARMALATQYQNNNEIEKSREHYKIILEYQPNNVAALNNLAWSLAEEGNMAAVAYAEKAYRLSGENPAVMDTYGWALLKTGKSIPDAINIFKEILLKSPDLKDARYHLAYAYYKAGNNNSARNELEWLKRFGYSDGSKLTELETLLK